MAVAFPSHATPGDPMQLAINLRGELVQSIFVAPAPRLKQLGDLVSEGVVHPNLRGRRSGNCVNITPPGGLRIRCARESFFLTYRFPSRFSLYGVKANQEAR